MGYHGKRRKHSIIDRLPAQLKSDVEQMLQAEYTYAEIAEYIRVAGYPISTASVWRYARGLADTLQELRYVNEGARAIMETLAKYPQLDVTEGILRIAAYNVLEAVRGMPEDKWRGMEPEDLLRQASSLVRAAGYKQRTDLQSKTTLEAGYEQAKAMLFDAMSREQPELYEAVSKYLESKRTEGAE